MRRTFRNIIIRIVPNAIDRHLLRGRVRLARATRSRKKNAVLEPRLQRGVDMAAPSQPAGTSSSVPVKQGKPPTPEEKQAKHNTEGIKNPKGLLAMDAPKPGKPDRNVANKERQLEDIEKMIEERAEVKTAATVYFSTESMDKPGPKQKGAQKLNKIAPFPSAPSPSSRGQMSPMSGNSPMSRASPTPVASPKKSEMSPGRQATPISVRTPRPYRQKLFIAAVVLLVIVGAAVVSLTVWTSIGPSYKVNYACKTPICEKVMKQLSEFANSTVKPCDDFYSHVCGHWLRMAEGSTFMRDAKKQFTHRRHALLTSPFNSSEPNSEVLETAQAFYTSCLAMFGEAVELKTALNELYSALNVSVKKWLAETRWQRFFSDCFDLSLKNHFHSLFKVNRYSAAEGPYFSVLLGRSFYQQMQHSEPVIRTKEYMRRVLEKIGEAAPSHKVIEEVITLDSAWQTRGAMKGAPTSPARVADVSCGPFTADTWGAKFAEHGASNDTAVRTAKFSLTCAFMEHVLLNSSSQARALYLLTLLAAHVLTYDFQLSISRSTQALMSICQRGARRVFREMWVHALSQMLSLKRPYVRDIRNYTDFGTRLRRVISERDWMSAEDREACLERVEGFQVTVFPDSAMSVQQLECSPFGQGDRSISRFSLSSTFIKNFVHVLKVQLSPSCLHSPHTSTPGRTLDAFLGTDIMLDLAKKTVIVPQFLGVEPLFYVGDVDRFINIATVTTLVASLGATIAKRPLKVSDVSGVSESTEGQWSDETSGKYDDISRCLAAKYKLPGDKSGNETKLDDVFAIMDGIRVAKITKDEFDEEDAETNERHLTATDALFFKRACLSLCASNKVDVHVTEHSFSKASAACNYGVGRMREFHSAFGCNEKDRMWTIMQCFDRYTEKE
ncbi:uncharacterized protein [Dermacentor albipictus]|uniref:uncharacterized protein isoform X2 n=1 Tax=Dermacentor albipictus TaxID=60249 RepID=UPI0038FD2A5F